MLHVTRFTVVTLFWALCASATIWPHPKSIKVGKGHRPFQPSQVRLNHEGGAELPEDVVKAFHRTMNNIQKYPLVGYPGRKGAASADGSGEQLQEITIRLKSGQKQDKRLLQHDKRTIKQVALEADDSDLQERSDQDGSYKEQAQMDHDYANHTDSNGAKGIAAEIFQPLKQIKEAYTLTIPDNGPAEITSDSALGILRALTSFEHLVYSRQSNSFTIDSTPIEIHDEAEYPYRGILIDTARNYYTIEELKHQIDAMSFVKMNQFHWHIVDSQSFPLKLDGELSVLAEKGAYSPQQVYDEHDIKDITSYAAERGVGVVVEIDMPGHNYEGVAQYDKSLLACPNKHPWQVVSNEPPSGQLKIGEPEVDAYVKKLLTATLKLLPGQYFSTGNDEVNLKCYGVKNESDIDESKLKPFVKKAHDVIRQAGKTPAVWEEAAINFPRTGKILSKGTLVQAWTTPDNVGKILASNPDVLLLHSPTPYFYLDCGRGEWLTNTTDPSYCDFVPFGKMYSFDPTNGTDASNAHRVIGGEACLWGEQSDGTTADNLIWPRTGAAAEVFWTGKKKTYNGKQTPLDLIEATKRLNELRYRFVARGVRATPVQPQWCLKNSGSCLLDIVPDEDKDK